MFIESPQASLQVKVKWWEAYMQLYKCHILNAKTKVAEDIKLQEDTQRKRRVIHGRKPGQPLQSFSSLSGSLRVSTVRSNYPGFHLTEIFSICVGGITEEGIHALCGTILVHNGATKCHIYNKDESCFQLMEDNNIVSTEGPGYVVTNCELDIIINLKDPVRGLEVSRGYFGWYSGQLVKNGMSWLDKRLCSVIRGKHGSAAVHYMIFNDAFRAHVEVSFFSDSLVDAPANVYGHLIAYYDGCDYSKSYQRKYYRSILFELPENKPVELMTGSKLTLSRSVVAVPALCSLLIDADLNVFGLTGVCNSEKGSVFGTLEFEIDRSSCTRKEIKGDNCWIELSVKFQ